MRTKITLKKLTSKKMTRRIMRAMRERKLITGDLTDEQLLILTHAIVQAILFDTEPISKKYPLKEKKK